MRRDLDDGHLPQADDGRLDEGKLGSEAQPETGAAAEGRDRDEDREGDRRELGLRSQKVESSSVAGSFVSDD